MEVKYNVSYRITLAQYQRLKAKFGMIVAHRVEAGKYYFKLLDPRYSAEVGASLLPIIGNLVPGGAQSQ